MDIVSMLFNGLAVIIILLAMVFVCIIIAMLIVHYSKELVAMVKRKETNIDTRPVFEQLEEVYGGKKCTGKQKQ